MKLNERIGIKVERASVDTNAQKQMPTEQQRFNVYELLRIHVLDATHQCSCLQ